MPSNWKLILLAPWLLLPASSGPAYAVEPTPAAQAIGEIRRVGPQGRGHVEALAAAATLQKAEAQTLPVILAGMNGANPLAVNWLRGAFESIAERQLAAGKKLPLAELEAFLNQPDNSPHARRLAYEWICRCHPEAETRLVRSFLNDASLELRREAVAFELAAADKHAAANDAGAAKQSFRRALDSARDQDQVELAAKKLRELGEPVDLAAQFGFVQHWWLIGPFDNRNKMGFNEAYPPEKQIELASRYAGKEGEVVWKKFVTDHEMGKVDLNKAVAKHMGAVAYAYAEFQAAQARDIELRLGCICANKMWLNGELLAANEIYHAGQQLDQYTGRGKLRAGKNTLLLKICQNEQTEEWAQDWEFQLRVCDALGTAVHSTDRQKVPPRSTEGKMAARRP